MSLARLALRIAAVETLAPEQNAANGPWLTAAGPRVYDSRIDPVALATTVDEYEQALGALENKPLITIYSEDDHRQPYGSQTIWPDEQTVTLVAEIMIPQIGQIAVEVPDPANPGQTITQQVGTLTPGATDREREGLLDLIDSQVRRAFDTRNRLAPLFAAVFMECRQISDDPQRDAHRTARLAMRTVKFHIKIKKEVWPAPGQSGLPAPLSTIAGMLPAGTSAANLCAVVAGALSGTPALPEQLTGLMIFSQLDRGNTGVTAAEVASGQNIPTDIQSQVGSPTPDTN